jgi:hypothetical protein
MLSKVSSLKATGAVESLEEGPVESFFAPRVDFFFAEVTFFGFGAVVERTGKMRRRVQR